MSAVGLTKAMRAALEKWRDCSRDGLAVDARLIGRGFLHDASGHYDLTPRGHAALAAPRVTAAEYEGLCEAEKGWTPTPARMRNRLHSLGWVVGLGIYASHLTPAGTTALNNVRAASGSPKWKEN